MDITKLDRQIDEAIKFVKEDEEKLAKLKSEREKAVLNSPVTKKDVEELKTGFLNVIKEFNRIGGIVEAKNETNICLLNTIITEQNRQRKSRIMRIAFFTGVNVTCFVIGLINIFFRK